MTLRIALYWIFLLPLLAGCSRIRAEVDTRLTNEPDLQGRMLRGAYMIRGLNPAMEASLEFEEFADLWQRGLKQCCPDLRRVAIDQPADLNLTLAYNLIDRGVGLETYPVYGPMGCYPGWYGGGYYGGAYTRVEPVHLGYDHLLSVSAWIADANRPAGRCVLWEGFSRMVNEQRSLKPTMPYLVIALASRYGQATAEPEWVKFHHDDERVRDLIGSFGPPSKPQE